MGYTEWHGREEEKPPPEEGEERKVGETFTISFQRPLSRRRSLGQEVIGKGSRSRRMEIIALWTIKMADEEETEPGN